MTTRKQKHISSDNKEKLTHFLLIVLNTNREKKLCCDLYNSSKHRLPFLLTSMKSDWLISGIVYAHKYVNWYRCQGYVTSFTLWSKQEKTYYATVAESHVKSLYYSLFKYYLFLVERIITISKSLGQYHFVFFLLLQLQRRGRAREENDTWKKMKKVYIIEKKGDQINVSRKLGEIKNEDNSELKRY